MLERILKAESSRVKTQQAIRMYGDHQLAGFYHSLRRLTESCRWVCADDDLLAVEDERRNRCDILPPSIFCPLAKSRFASATCKGGIESLRVEPHSHGKFAQDSWVPDVAQLTEARVE